MKKATFSIPKEVTHVTKTLRKAGFEAYLVGGCVRDLFLDKTPKDWDVTTNATPDEIIAVFPKTFYENTFGTVGVVNEEEGTKESLKIIEVTPYRLESTYSDNRHPDTVMFSKNIEDDLKRRDFTINAIAFDEDKGHLIDPYKGQEAIREKIITAVGEADERFKEDALRMLRALRLAAELGFTINKETEKAIKMHVNLLNNIAKERIRDEFVKIVMSSRPMEGLQLAEKLGMLSFIAPDLEKGVGMSQTQAHAYSVWEHLLRTLQHAADKGWPLELRLAALFHDVAKPHTKKFSSLKNTATFYGHEVVGARITKKILENLRFPRKTIDEVTNLVRWHMFFSDTEQITLTAVRRMITNVGKENIWTLMNLRICDRVGTGRPKENPYRLRKYKAMIEEALRDPLTVGMLKIDGKDLMEKVKLAPGPKIGHILHALLEEVLEDPKLNTEEYLLKRAEELSKLDEVELKKKGEEGRQRKDEEEEKSIGEIREKHWVK
jgi:tRNA nucleotidyltransferase (CCA-adding enzyme)